MNKLRFKDFSISTRLPGNMTYKGNYCYHTCFHDQRIGPEFGTKKEANEYIRKLVKYGNYFLIDNPTEYNVLSEKVTMILKRNVDLAHCTDPVERRAIRIKQMLDSLNKLMKTE